MEDFLPIYNYINYIMAGESPSIYLNILLSKKSMPNELIIPIMYDNVYA
jgi:hypothetical protein